MSMFHEYEQFRDVVDNAVRSNIRSLLDALEDAFNLEAAGCDDADEKAMLSRLYAKANKYVKDRVNRTGDVINRDLAERFLKLSDEVQQRAADGIVQD